MKKIWLYLTSFLMIINIAFANENSIQNHAFDAPANVSTNTHKLARYLTKPYKDDYDKLKVIAYWIASHISYDEYQYKNGKVNYKESAYQYDILKAKAGVCTDFAQLFLDMAQASGISNVEIVNGYVLENQHSIKRSYKKKDMPTIGHAWNEAEIDGRKFFIDTTFMARGTITPSGHFNNSFRHKMDLKKNGRNNSVNTNINSFYFDFTPKSELKKDGILHVKNKFIR